MANEFQFRAVHANGRDYLMLIGPTFAAEIKAAGLQGLPFAWGNDGSIAGRENLTPAQNAALDNVLAAHDPNAEPDWETLDMDTINQTLSQPGSIIRALGILTFKEINKLRQFAGLSQYTLEQFKTALRNEMRNGV